MLLRIEGCEVALDSLVALTLTLTLTLNLIGCEAALDSLVDNTTDSAKESGAIARVEALEQLYRGLSDLTESTVSEMGAVKEGHMMLTKELQALQLEKLQETLQGKTLT